MEDEESQRPDDPKDPRPGFSLTGLWQGEKLDDLLLASVGVPVSLVLDTMRRKQWVFFKAAMVLKKGGGVQEALGGISICYENKGGDWRVHLYY